MRFAPSFVSPRVSGAKRAPEVRNPPRIAPILASGKKCTLTRVRFVALIHAGPVRATKCTPEVRNVARIAATLVRATKCTLTRVGVVARIASAPGAATKQPTHAPTSSPSRG
jgi:hypothetical protein